MNGNDDPFKKDEYGAKPTFGESNSYGTNYGSTFDSLEANSDLIPDTTSVSPAAGAATTSTNPIIDPVVNRINESVSQLTDDPVLQQKVREFVNEVAQLAAAKSSEAAVIIKQNPKKVAVYSLIAAGAIAIGVGAVLMYNKKLHIKTKKYKRTTYKD